MEKQIMKLVALIVGLVLAGCEEFDPGSLITDVRVLGARVEVEGDEGRASPRPGETANITWIVAAPGEVPTLKWAFVACMGGVESCDGAPLVFAQGEGRTPALTLTIPARAELADADRIQVLGVVCDGGAPTLGEQGEPRCEGKHAKATAVTLDVRVAPDGQPGNLNPNLDDASLALEGKPWAAETAVVASGECAENRDLPQVKAGSKKRQMRLSLGAGARERYSPAQGPATLETLQVSHFVTDGELDGQFSFVETADDSERPSLSFEWDPPAAKHVPGGGALVRLIVVVRDLRGGLAVTERALCVVR